MIRISRDLFRNVITLVILCGSCRCALAETHHTFWQLKGKHNTVYLLGSVHILKSQDSALPPEVLRAFKDSKSVTMELNSAEITTGALQESTLNHEVLPGDQSLSDVLGPDLYAEFKTYANSLGFDTDFMTHDQPWYAAMKLQLAVLARKGFDAEYGVEMQSLQLAKADAKPVLGLETFSEQLALFSQLSMQEQRQYLQSTIEEAAIEATQVDAIVAAWKHGDLDALEKISREGFAKSPDLYKKLILDRNRKWLPKFIDLLHSDEDCFIVVGAAHLVGHGGMLELLRKQGFRAVQH